MSLKRFRTRNGVRFVVAAVVIAVVATWLGFVVISPSGGGLTGRFVARGVPEPPGSSSNTYSYAQFAVDPSNATVLDVGFVDSPMTWPNSSAAVDIPVGLAVAAG